MTKLWKRLGALMMTLAMVLSLGAGITAFAAEPTLVTIDFGNVQDGDTVNAYMLVKYNSTYTDYEFNDDNFKAFVIAHYADVSTEAEALAKFKTLNNAGVKELMAAYETAIQAGTATKPAVTPISAAAAGATASLADMTPGYYLVRVSTTATNSYVYTPVSIFVRRIGDKLEVYAAGSDTKLTAPYTVNMKRAAAPSVAKHVKDQEAAVSDYAASNTAAVGDTVSFRVAVIIPDYTDVSVKLTELILHDTLTNMSYVDGSAKVYSDENCTNNQTAAYLESATSDTYTSGTQTLTIQLKPAAIGNNKTVYVYYEAVVQKEAAASDQSFNEVYLTSKNSVEPTVDRTSPSDGTKTYSFALKLNKVKEDGTTPLDGASFTVYKDAAGTKKVMFTKAEGYYYPDAAGTVDAVPATGGTFLIKGLDATSYWLKETTVPIGYYEPAGMFKVTLTANNNGVLQATSSFEAVNAASDSSLIVGTPSITQSNASATTGDQYNVGLKNSNVPILPTTGGMGTMLFTVLGVILMALAAGLFFFRRRKNA